MKILFSCFIFLISLIFFFSVIPLSTYAQVTQSNCVITAIGNPPKYPTLPPGCQKESAVVQKVIALAKAHLKKGTYIMGAPSRDWASEDPNKNNAPTHFDCSGFVGWAWYWGSDGKVSMLGQTTSDWARSTPLYKKVVTTDESQLQPGDLIYINNGLAEAQPGHVGLFVGRDSCGANDCYMQYYQTGLAGNELSLKWAQAHGWGKMMGFIRINLP